MLGLEAQKDQITQHWRWQFLRLNPEYRSLYKRMSRLSKENQNLFFEKFGITKIVDYGREELPAKIRICGNYDFAVKVGSLDSVFPQRGKKQQTMSWKHPEALYYLCEMDEDHARKCNVTIKGKKLIFPMPVMTIKAVQAVINLDAPIKNIMAEVKSLVTSSQQRRRKSLKLKRTQIVYGTSKSGTNETTKHFALIVRAYKLREEQGLSYKKIAEELGVKSASSVDPLVSKSVKGKHRGTDWIIKNYLKEARKKINDREYLQISL